MVSVIVACYNVEKFMDSGMASITGQSYSDCEFILVDDGSTDGTFAKILEWEGRDSRIRHIRHSANQGLGAARNNAIDAAKGEYICFADIDDRVHPEMVATCVKSMEKHRAEMMLFGFNAIQANQPNIADHIRHREQMISSNRDLRETFVESVLLSPHGFAMAWSQFYRKSFLDRHAIRFGNQIIQQDIPFALQAFRHVERLYISPEILYDYYIYSSGNTRSQFLPQRMDIFLDIDRQIGQFLDSMAIRDSRAEEFRQSRLWGGLLTYLDHDLRHPKSGFDARERNRRAALILSNRRIKELLNKGEFCGSRNKIKARVLSLGLISCYYSFVRLESRVKALIRGGR